MKKDIVIPEVKGVYAAVVRELLSKEEAWNVYLVNDRNEMIEGVMVTSKGYAKSTDGEEINTSTMRHMVGNVPAKTAVKIEAISPEVFALNNEYWVTFFQENQLMEKKYIFGSYTIDEVLFEHIPVMDTKGVLIK